MTRFLTSLSFLLFTATSFAQLANDEFKLSFTKDKAPVNDEMVDELDSIARFLESGSSVHLPLVTKRELKKDDKFAKELSFRRYKNIVAYFVDNQYPFVTVSEVVQPISQVKHAKASSNASYKAFANGTSGIYSIVLHRGEDVFKCYTTSAEPIDDVPTQEFNVSCYQFSVIQASGGTRIVIPSEAFAPMGNDDCCSVTLKVREYTNLSSMIQGNLSTHSNGKMLRTAGSLHISAWCNGKEVQLRAGKEIAIYFSSDQEVDMRAFWGDDSNGHINWRLDESAEVEKLNDELGPIPPLDPEDLKADLVDFTEEGGYGYYDELFMEYAQETDGYLLRTAKLGWINCDEFYELPEKEKMDFFVKIDDVKGTAVRLVFNDIGSIMSASNTQYGNMVGFNGIPRNSDATLLAYSKKGDKYYLNKQRLNAEQGEVVEMEVTEISKAQFDAQIKAL